MSTQAAAQTTNSADPKAVETAPVTQTTAVETKTPEATAQEAAAKATQTTAAAGATEKKEEPAAKDPEAKAGAPEKYALTLPKDSKLGAEVVAKIEADAKAKGWSNERAQEAVNDRNAWEVEREQAHSQALQNLHDKVWLEQLKADPVVGGQKFEESSHMAAKALERFMSKEDREALTSMKLNRQPILFKLAAAVGRAMESDKAVIQNQNPGDASLPKEQQMYPSMFKKE